MNLQSGVKRSAGMVRDPECERVTRAVVRSWRELAGGPDARDGERPTLVACSGGADSSALAVTLSRVRRATVVIGHVVHDMRSAPESLRDRDAVRELAGRLGRPFVEASVGVRELAGNAEGNARALRYRALARLAAAHGCRYVATGHQSDDLLEKVLMLLLRGTGVRGLSGIAPSRPLGSKVTLIRPMLVATREDSEGVCAGAGVAWCDDATNRDESRMRGALRSRVTPVLRELSPSVRARVRATAEVLRDADELISLHARSLVNAASRSDGGVRFERARLRGVHPAVLAEVLRRLAAELGRGRGGDRIGQAALKRVRDAVHDASTRPREFVLGGAAVRITAREVTLGREVRA